MSWIHRIRLTTIAVLAIALVLLVSCGGGSNLPSASRSVSLPTPSHAHAGRIGRDEHVDECAHQRGTDEHPDLDVIFVVLVDEHANEDLDRDVDIDRDIDIDIDNNFDNDFEHVLVLGELHRRASSASSSPVPETTSTPIWPWILLALLLIAGVVAYVLRRRSTRAASAEVRKRALDAYAGAIALHDQAAVLPMTSDADRPRMLGDVTANLDRVMGEFDALAGNRR